MDPPHITEFASRRYFEKLRQRESGAAVPVSLPAASTSFHLPLRELRSLDPQLQRQRQSLFSALRLSKKSPAAYECTARAPDSRLRSSSGRSLESLFLALPNELQVQVLSSLLLVNVLSLRLVSRFWHAVVSVHEMPIVRCHLAHCIPSYASRLFPPTRSSMNVPYLAALAHRLSSSSVLADLICDWITDDIFLRKSSAQRSSFAPQRERIRSRLAPLLFVLLHFFETYRELHLDYIQDHGGHGLRHTPYVLDPIELRIMSQYDDRTLLRVHEIFPILLSAIRRRLRPPSYVGRFERSLRGYLRDEIPEQTLVAILCVGGLRKAVEFWQIKGYNSRIAAVDQWYGSLFDQPVDSRPKPIHSRKFLSRGRAQGAGEPASAGPYDASSSRAQHSDTSLARSSTGSAPMSLSSGLLAREKFRTLMDDMPSLEQVWSRTAESLLLQRNIVSSLMDVRRNAHVMLTLIQEGE